MLVGVEAKPVHAVLLDRVPDPLLKDVPDLGVLSLDVGKRKDGRGLVIPELAHLDRGLVGVVHHARAVEVLARVERCEHAVVGGVARAGREDVVDDDVEHEILVKTLVRDS